MQKKQVLAVLQTNGSGVLSFAGVSASAGQVIQVLSATDSTVRSTTSSSFATASNTLSVTITPSSASNKILIMYSLAFFAQGYRGNTTIFRGATNLGNTNGFTSDLPHQTTDDFFVSTSSHFLDSPATTSATTYQVYMKSSGASVKLNNNTETSSITVMEIKG